MSPIRVITKETAIQRAKRELDTARWSGDLLRIELAESALNALLDEYQTDQTESKR